VADQKIVKTGWAKQCITNAHNCKKNAKPIGEGGRFHPLFASSTAATAC